MMEKGIFVLLSTCPDAVTAERIARELVGASLVACVNVVPGLPRADRLSEARERLVALHPYDVPEVVALPVVDGHHPYLQWVADSTRTP